jgi:hypothetical protein
MKAKTKRIVVHECVEGPFTVKITEGNDVYMIDLWRDGSLVSTTAPFFSLQKAIAGIGMVLETHR